MATYMRVQPPTRPDGQELIRYKCDTCSDITTDPESHIRAKRHDRHLILTNTSMTAWYANNAQKEDSQ